MSRKTGFTKDSNPPQQTPATNKRPANCWQLGEIAFLKTSESFNDTDYNDLIASGKISPLATCHPVIILEKSDDARHYLVTTISAYSSGHDNGFLPPWKQYYHKYKQPDNFRAFDGSTRPNTTRAHLHLAGNKFCPKRKTSWVYVKCAMVVPSTTLGFFNKPRDQLRMTSESLADLLLHMKENNPFFERRWTDHGLSNVDKKPPPPQQSQQPSAPSPPTPSTLSTPVAVAPVTSVNVNSPSGTKRSWAKVAATTRPPPKDTIATNAPRIAATA